MKSDMPNNKRPARRPPPQAKSASSERPPAKPGKPAKPAKPGNTGKPAASREPSLRLAA